MQQMIRSIGVAAAFMLFSMDAFAGGGPGGGGGACKVDFPQGGAIKATFGITITNFSITSGDVATLTLRIEHNGRLHFFRKDAASDPAHLANVDMGSPNILACAMIDALGAEVVNRLGLLPGGGFVITNASLQNVQATSRCSDGSEDVSPTGECLNGVLTNVGDITVYYQRP
jgi:hypothetical protein